MSPTALMCDIEDDTAVVGDVDQFIAHLESGGVYRDWCMLSEIAQRALDLLLPSPMYSENITV